MEAEWVRRPTVARVDVSALIHNVSVIRDAIGPHPRIMAVVKANAYGHGLVDATRVFAHAGVDAVGVAFLEEGIQLREAGIRLPILVLGGLIGNQVQQFLEHDLQLTAASPYKVEQIDDVAARMGCRAKVHLKLDTGMHRIGVRAENSTRLFETARRAAHVDVVGVFSHLAESESDNPEFTLDQLERFRRGTEDPDRTPQALLHLANSGAIFGHPPTHFDMVRPGLALYGISPDGKDYGLRPALSLHTRVVFFKVVEAGSPVSYDRTWHAPERTRLVTLPVGYGDGYARALSNRAQVLIRGCRYPVVGRVTMDATMVDIGADGTAYNGDTVVLLGQVGSARVGVEDHAAWSDTNPYEVLTRISDRVPRVYVDATGAEIQPAALQPSGEGPPTILSQ